MFRRLFIIIVILLLSGLAFGAHPLITDDTGTQGKGKIQLEVNSEFTYDKETWDRITTEEIGGEVAAILSYGLIDNTDMVLGVPYLWGETIADGTVTSDVYGISDMPLELKWRFYEKDGLGFAVKPGIILPTGDEDKSLGNGRTSYSLVFIITKKIEPWAFNLNLGYTYNEYERQEDKDADIRGIWHASLASEVEVVKDLKLVANIGIERNLYRTLNTHSPFILGGIIYSITENLDVDLGVKGELNELEADYSILAGMAIRF